MPKSDAPPEKLDLVPSQRLAVRHVKKMVPNPEWATEPRPDIEEHGLVG